MGAWGAGSFENDTALDFAGAIETAEDLLGPLSIENPDEPIDADQACEIIVVAECVAAMRGHPNPDMPRELLERVKTFGQPGKSLFHHSRDHLAAVLERSELKKLWEEEELGEFLEANHELIGRLNRKAGELSDEVPEPPYAESPCPFCNEQLGRADIADLNVTYGEGQSATLGFLTIAHLDCLNRALHPNFRSRPFTMHDEDMPEGEGGLLKMLDEKPNLKE